MTDHEFADFVARGGSVKVLKPVEQTQTAKVRGRGRTVTRKGAVVKAFAASRGWKAGGRFS